MKGRKEKTKTLKRIPYNRGDEKWLRTQCAVDKIENKGKVVRYLKKGVVLLTAPYIERDVIGDGRLIGPGMSILTDGEWAWESTIAYWVRNYNFVLPDEFIQHIESRNWQPRDPATIDKRNLVIPGVVSEDS